jgi:hypothetical protein
MTLSTHVAIGAAIGFAVGNPWLGFGLGMLSHFLVDMIPHGDTQFATSFYEDADSRKFFLKYISIDATIALLLILGIFAFFEVPTSDLALAGAIAGSILPDLLTGAHEILKTRLTKKYVKLHFFFHDFFTSRFGDIKLRHALTGQAVVIAIILNSL